MTRKEQDKVLQALKHFRIHASEEQKKEASALLEKDCKTDVSFNEYIQFKPIIRIFNWNKL